MRSLSSHCVPQHGPKYHTFISCALAKVELSLYASSQSVPKVLKCVPQQGPMYHTFISCALPKVELSLCTKLSKGSKYLCASVSSTIWYEFLVLLGISFLLHTVIRFVSGEMRCSRQGGGHVHYVFCCCSCCCLLLLVMVTHTLGLSRDAAFVGYSERYLGRQSSSLENHGSFACLCSSPPTTSLSCAMLSLPTKHS